MTTPEDDPAVDSPRSQVEVAGNSDNIAVSVTGLSDCPYCGPVVKPEVEILRVDRQQVGWASIGRISDFAPQFCPCPRCAMAVRAIEAKIPVELARFACPSCESDAGLQYKILRIERQQSGYLFAAEAVRGDCARTSLAKRLFRALGRISRIKVGASGIEVELVE